MQEHSACIVARFEARSGREYSGAGRRIGTLRVVEISARVSTRGTRAGGARSEGGRRGCGRDGGRRQGEANASYPHRIRIATVVRARSHDARIYVIMQM